MNPEQRYKTITCIMPAGRGREVHNRLMREHGVLSATTHHARGLGSGTMQRRRVLVGEEKDVLVVLAEAQRADELFAFLYEAARIGEPHAGLIFMSRAGWGHAMVPPVAPEGGAKA
jgi:hypothetical protein